MQTVREAEEISELNPVDDQLKSNHREPADRTRAEEAQGELPVVQLFPAVADQQKRQKRSEENIVEPHHARIAEQNRKPDQSLPSVFRMEQERNAAEHGQR